MKKLSLVFAALFYLGSSFALAAKAKDVTNTKATEQSIEVPDIPVGVLSESEVATLANNFKAEKKRQPSGTVFVATEDMLSPEFVKFRNKVTACRNGVDFYQVIKEYDSNYDQIPATANDLKFVVARMAAWLPMRGIIWRMTPLVHKVVVTQEVLLASLRNFAEQVMINDPDSHIQAQLLFMSLPAEDLIGKQMHLESDFMRFLATEVYPSLAKSVERLEKVRMVNVKDGKEIPLVFDTRIRFGDQAFNSTYDAIERFKIVGEAERFAAIARINRRMAGIAGTVAYTWNGHLELRRKIGRMFGVAAAMSNLWDRVGIEDNYVSGATREDRAKIIQGSKGLYVETRNTGYWMKKAYAHLHRSYLYLDKTWQHIQKEDPNTYVQLDPEVFTGRREQIEAGMVNLKKLVGKSDKESGGNLDTYIGAVTGETVSVDFKGFYDQPPKDLKKLLPVKFAGNEDLDKLLKEMPFIKDFKQVRSNKPDVLTNKAKGVEFRNYLYGRAKAWDPSFDGYGRLFPGVTGEGVAQAMKILNETRGARMLSTNITGFIR
jgi:hypothetical protein